MTEAVADTGGPGVEPPVGSGSPGASLESGTPVAQETAGGALGMAFGLLLLVGAVAALALALVPFDGRATLDSILEDEAPWGFVLDGSSRTSGGDLLLRLVPPADGLSREEGGDAGADAEQPGDPEPPLPEEVLLVRYGSPQGVLDVFSRDGDEGGGREASRRMTEWEEEPFDWHTEMERGETSWKGWRAAFVRERAFDEEGTWRESLRVNLSTPGRYLAVFLHWPTGVPASEERLREFLAAVALEEDA